MPKQPKTQSSVIYRGPSLIDGKPIVVVAIVKSRNVKTSNMLQTYVLRADMSPCEASKTGEDYSICGNCPLRGNATSDPKKKQATDRPCYVILGQGPTIVYKSLEKGIYPDVSGHAKIAALGAGRMVRLGTYGDPAACPSYVWESLISEASGWTAYSHQSGIATADVRPDMFMISADNKGQAVEAWGKGQRTFRLIKDVGDMVKGAEILCPASKEAGERTTCQKCGLCAGASIKAKSIAIVAHGTGKKLIKAA